MRINKKIICICITLSLAVATVQGYGLGAPDSACNDLRPGHGGIPQPSDAPFTLTPSQTEVETGVKITVSLETGDGIPFKGFLVQGRDTSTNKVVGTFFTNDSNPIICGPGYNNAVTHKGNTQKSKIDLLWEATQDYSGDVMFMATFVRDFSTYWMGVTSEKLTVKRAAPVTIVFPELPTAAPTTAPTPAASTTAAPTTPPPTVSNTIGVIGGNVIDVVDGPSFSPNPDADVVPNSPNSSPDVGLPLFGVPSQNGNPIISTPEVVPPPALGPDSNPSPPFLESNPQGVPLLDANFVESSDPTESSLPSKTTRAFGIFTSPPPTTTTTTQTTTTSKPTTTKKTTTTGAPVTEDTKSKIIEKVSSSPQRNLENALSTLYLGCESFKGCLGIGAKDCIKKENCKALVTYNRDSSGSYAFELMAEASQGYVALGLSDDRTMGADSVMVCRNLGAEVDVAMGWNEKGVKSNSLLVDKQLDLSNIESGQIDGKILCRFRREKKTEINDMTFDLDNDKHHIMLAQGPLKPDGNLNYHSKKIVSGNKISLSEFTAIDTTIELFRLFHAVFMVGAWIGTASCGILFARYYKQTWSNSQCCSIDQWFHWHRFFMVLTWSLTVAGVACMVYYLKGWTTTSVMDNPHAVIGVVSFFLCFIQPFFAMCRPGPNAKNRPLFNWFHWSVGNLAQITGIVAMFYGLDLYGVPKWSWWILIAFVAFHCFMHLLLSIGQCISDSRKKRRGDVYPLKTMNSSRDPLQPAPGEKKDAPGGCFRKFMLAMYLILNWAFTAALIIVIIFDEEQLRDWNLLFWEKF